jgi:hypothetical protein
MYFMWVPHEADPARRCGLPKVLDPSADRSTLEDAVHGLTYDELVSAWDSSDRRLATLADPARQCAVVALRDLMLDELERRSTWRYRRWLRFGGPRRRTRRTDLPHGADAR